MPSYLWSGKDSSGREQVERIEAANAEAARTRLLDQGWTNLQLHSSEIQDFVKQGIHAASGPDHIQQLTPKEQLAHLKGNAPGFWANWWKTSRESATTLLILAGALAWAIYRQNLWSTIILGALLFGLLLLFPALHFWFGKTSELYQKLHKARNWRNWDEVLGCLEELRKTQISRKIGIGDAEMARYYALALAGKGKLAEVVEYFSAAAQSANMPKWLFYSHLASLHLVAERYDDMLDCYRRALEHATDKGIVFIDYAASLVQRFNRPVEARELLAKAESSQLPSLAKGHLSALHGVIAFREGNFAEATKFLS